jgi:hypothetical protein
MEKRLLFVLTLSALGAASLLPVPAAVAAPARAPEGTLLGYYDRIPGKHFAGFGGVNRRSLLQRKGAIVDYKRNFIEIPGSASPKDGDLRALQITLFPNGKEPWIAVSRIVWDQGRTPGTLNFYYGHNDAGGLREASSNFFPYRLKKIDGAYESAYLPRVGLEIVLTHGPGLHLTGPTFKYNPKFKVGQPAFIRVADDGTHYN